MKILVLIPILMLTAKLSHAQEEKTTVATTAAASAEAAPTTTTISTKKPLGDCNVTQNLDSTRQIGKIFTKIRDGISSHDEVVILQCTLGCQMIQAYSDGTAGLGVVFGIFAHRVPQCVELLRDPDGTVDQCEVPKCVYNFFYHIN
ncbi:hypothetical protein C0J52_08606 [Blattella germanica]|nr:hypothetical protein C0J52_08606 [Blattella germanica]